jgi:hypothetical protein
MILKWFCTSKPRIRQHISKEIAIIILDRRLGILSITGYPYLKENPFTQVKRFSKLSTFSLATFPAREDHVSE